MSPVRIGKRLIKAEFKMHENGRRGGVFTMLAIVFVHFCIKISFLLFHFYPCYVSDLSGLEHLFKHIYFSFCYTKANGD